MTAFITANDALGLCDKKLNVNTDRILNVYGVTRVL